MKLNKLFIAGSMLVASMGLGSCVGDLDLQPINPSQITSGVFSDDPEGYMRSVMADVYLNVATFGYNDGTQDKNILGSIDGGMSTFQRAVFNLEEVPSDETNWQPTADAIPHTLNYGEVVANETFILGSYQRLMVASSLCNQFIQTDFQLETIEDATKRAQAQNLREEFVREAKILRCGMYFYLVSEFGNVPYNDENVMIGEIAPQLSTDFATGRRMVTENVVNTLEELVAWYKTNDPNNKPPYGYVGLDVAEALLVKFYLNYEVFTGEAAWNKCYEHAQALISRLGNGGFQNSGLAMNYAQCFSFNNRTSAVNEIIWRIPNINSTQDSEGKGVTSYAGGDLLLCGYIGDTTADSPFHCLQSDYNSPNGWKCMSARRQLTEVFDWNADYTESPDQRTAWWKTAKDGFDINNEDMTQPAWGTNGFLPVKFTNWYINDDGSVNTALSPSSVPDPPSLDYGMIRLAEIYLSAAEAALHGAGSQGDALKYVNHIRERAGMPAYTTINLLELRNERQRELYTECNRRTDLIRYGLWISGYNWNWKNHSHDGSDFPANFNVYPLPTTVVNINGYVQNPGY